MINGRKKIGELFAKIGKIFGRKKDEPKHGFIPTPPIRESLFERLQKSTEKFHRKFWRKPKINPARFGRHVYFGTFRPCKHFK